MSDDLKLTKKEVVRKFRCRICKKKLKSAWDVVKHNRAVHPKGKEASVNDASLEGHIGYILGRIEAEIEAYARGVGVSPTVLASRVARLLHAKTRREMVGTEHHLSGVRGAPAR